MQAPVALKSAFTRADNQTMDILSLIGLLLAIIALVGGSILKGAGLGSLWSAAAFVIVILGTTAAIFVHTPPPVFRRAFAIVGWILRPDRKSTRLNSS